MYETSRVTTNITMKRYILKSTKDKLKSNTEKWARQGRREQKTEGICQKPIDNLNRAITKKEIKFVVKNKYSKTKYLGTNSFTGEHSKTFQEEITPTLHNILQTTEFLNSFYEIIIAW